MLRTLPLVSALLLAAPLAASVAIADEQPLTEFTKVEKRDDVGEVVRCSIRTYAPPPPPKRNPMGGMMGMMGGGNAKPAKRPEIVLISMIHLGEPGYFREVNKVLKTCDLVLYEEQGDADMGGMSGQMITELTGLSFQGTEIPFDEKTWRSADLSSESLFRMLGMDPETMKRMKEMSKRMGGMKLDKRMLESNPMLKQMIPSREKIVAQLRNSGGSEGMAEGFGEMANVILHQRNAIAIGELTKASHEERDRIVLIYGAAHMPAIEAYLRDTLGYTHQTTRWLDAVYADEAVSKARSQSGDTGPSDSPESPKAQPKPTQPKAEPKKPEGEGWF